MNWPPSVLDPAGPVAEQIAVLTWVLLAITGFILVLVCGALAVAIFGNAKLKGWLSGKATILVAGFAVPVFVLAGLLVYSLIVTRSLAESQRDTFMTVRITGEMWWWRVSYLDRNGQETVTDANELNIPVAENVRIELRSNDVIHSFWVPRLAGKIDLIPGRVNTLTLAASRAGIYSGQCAEFCGGPHALMGFVVVAHDRDGFQNWLNKRKTHPPLPVEALARRGLELFLSIGCSACHQVRGTPATGQAGPDLTYVGARQKLGAGILPNNRGTLAGWVADSQTIKPGNRMPRYGTLSAGELQAIAAYLEQLR